MAAVLGNTADGFTVVVDAGHGGEDGGATSISGVQESQINLTVSSSSFNRGWYIMKAKDDVADVDFFPNAYPAEGSEPTRNMIALAGCTLHGNPVAVAWQEYNYCHPVVDEYGTTNIELLEAWHFVTDRDMLVLQGGGDMIPLKDYDEQFYTPPTSHNPQAFFFFDTFNELIGNGKQIVLAADRTPAQLGMGKDGFDERVTSRLASGFSMSIQVPSYELKLRLIETFCERMREDAARENVPALSGVVPDAAMSHMAELAGTNIRVIEGFCQRCLFAATAAEGRGREISREEIGAIAKECWPSTMRSVSIEDVQKAVEKAYDIDHASLVGSKRHKTVMEARHVAIWLSRELCDRTLADIGKHFGGRSHATVMHSISVIDETKREDKAFYDRLMQIRDSIAGNA